MIYEGPWTVNWEGQGQNINEFKYFKRWFDELSERPAVQRGMAVGANMQNDYSKLSKEELDALRALLTTSEQDLHQKPAV